MENKTSLDILEEQTTNREMLKIFKEYLLKAKREFSLGNKCLRKKDIKNAKNNFNTCLSTLNNLDKYLKGINDFSYASIDIGNIVGYIFSTGIYFSLMSVFFVCSLCYKKKLDDQTWQYDAQLRSTKYKTDYYNNLANEIKKDSDYIYINDEDKLNNLNNIIKKAELLKTKLEESSKKVDKLHHKYTISSCIGIISGVLFIIKDIRILISIIKNKKDNQSTILKRELINFVSNIKKLVGEYMKIKDV